MRRLAGFTLAATLAAGCAGPSGPMPSTTFAPTPSAGIDVAAIRTHMAESNAELTAQGKAMTTGNLSLTFTKVRNWADDELAWIETALPADVACLRDLRRDYRDAVSAAKLLAEQTLDALANNNVAGLNNLATQGEEIGRAVGAAQRTAQTVACQ